MLLLLLCHYKFLLTMHAQCFGQLLGYTGKPYRTICNYNSAQTKFDAFALKLHHYILALNLYVRETINII